MDRSGDLSNVTADSPEYRAWLSRQRIAAARLRHGEKDRAVQQWIVRILFGAFFFMSVVMVLVAVAGIPIRAVFGVCILGYLALAHPAEFAVSLTKQRTTLLIILGFAILGTVVSLLNGSAAAAVGRQILEIHVQAAVNLLVAATVLEVCGPRTILYTFLAVIGLSALVAIPQALGIQAAWSLRLLFGVAGVALDDDGEAGRAVGLSLTPIVLATQLCLSFALIYIYRRHYGRPSAGLDPAVIAGAVVFSVVCLASGNRSPLLGMALFLVIYGTMRLGPVALVGGSLFLALAPLVPILLHHAEQSGVRALTMQNKSSVGRWPLIVYGWHLFADHPLGYGLDFDPLLHWQAFWKYVANLQNAEAIEAHPLHNYVLTTLNKYGVFALFLAAISFRLMAKHRDILLCFIPYAAHILFHNDGPFAGDFIIWFIIAFLSNDNAVRAAKRWAPRRGGRAAIGGLAPAAGSAASRS
jgi:hypothetical protein